MYTVYVILLSLGVTVCVGAKTTVPEGIAKFWMDDMKALDQIYGKTSDKQLYGDTLPPTVSSNINLKKKIKAQESQKKERFTPLTEEDIDSVEQFTPYDPADRYAKQFEKNLKTEKSKKNPLHFIGLSNFKPISESSDPETYSYLKHLERLENHKLEIPDANGFKPYTGKTEEEEAYRSIQEILDAHEANKGKYESKYNDSLEKLRYGPKDDEYRYAAKAVPTKSKVRFLNNNSINSRCRSGRCRKRPAYRSVSRPYIRKVKRYRIA